MELIKFQLKVMNKMKQYEWVHFCYVPTKDRDAFDAKINNRGWLNNQWVTRWAKRDFGLSRIDTPEGLAELKTRIRQAAKNKYPDVYIESSTDNQGWLRVWVTQHIKRELIEHGRESIQESNG